MGNTSGLYLLVRMFIYPGNDAFREPFKFDEECEFDSLKMNSVTSNISSP